MEKEKNKFVGKILENEVNPTEKICDLLKCKNLQDLIRTFRRSENASEAIKESFIPLGECLKCHYVKKYFFKELLTNYKIISNFIHMDI